MFKLKPYRRNTSGITSILEMVIATAIIFTIIGLFYTSINNLIGIHVRSDVDVRAKCLDVYEVLTRTPGLSSTLQRNWEDETTLAKARGETVIPPSEIGLAATPTISYGVFNLSNPAAGPAYFIFQDPLYHSFLKDPFGNVVSSCFLVGTQVAMANGSYRTIETLHIGDTVMSFNQETGEIEPSTIVNVLHHPPEEMTEYYLVINGFLKVTPNHLFYDNGTWQSFDQLKVGEIIHGITISSIEKIYEKVPTYDLTVEHHHTYLVRLSDQPIVVHNNEIILPFNSPNSWLPASKYPYMYDETFETFGANYYVEYTFYDPEYPDDGGIYEVKGGTTFPYAVLDATKISALSNISYENVKDILGFKQGTPFQSYDINITIVSPSYSTPFYYGPYSEYTDSTVSVSRDVLIYHPPSYRGDSSDFSDFIPPFYEGGQITVTVYQ